jgi:UDP-glucose/GDP-mannose dehydrogenase family, NAD binding domain
MSDEWTLKICCMGAGYVGGPTMAVIAKMCPKVRGRKNCVFLGKSSLFINQLNLTH